MSTRQTNHEGENSLLKAAYSGELEIVKILLAIDHNSINQRDRLGYDIFLKACGYGHCELIDYLHEKYTNRLFETKNYSDCNGLQVAADSPSVEAVSHLLTLHQWSQEDLEKSLDIATSYRNGAETSDKKFIRDRVEKYKHIEDIVNTKLRKFAIPETIPLSSNEASLFHSASGRISESDNAAVVPGCDKNS